ncbi:MAG: DUF2273 domain-containing protein [Christensenellales bacterium]
MPCTLFGMALGLIFAVLCLTIGVGAALLIALFCLIGAFIGGVKDKRSSWKASTCFFSMTRTAAIERRHFQSIKTDRSK